MPVAAPAAVTDGQSVISEADIVNGYLWLLGRSPSAEEIAANHRHYQPMETGAAEDLRRHLTGSVEARTQRLRFNRIGRLCDHELDGRRLVFVHLPKCGGTTLHAMLCSQFASDRICPERHDTLGDWTINELATYDLFSGHFDVSCCRSIPGRLSMVTMLRAPKSRLLSLYHFWRAHRPHPDRDGYDLLRLARSCSIEAFFGHPTVIAHTTIRNAMTGQLIRTSNKTLLEPQDLILSDPAGALEQAWATLRGFTTFGIMERFEPSRLLFNQALGLDMQPVAPQQVLETMLDTNAELIRHKREPAGAGLDRLLAPLVDIDQPLYDRALALFEQRAAALATPAASPAAAAGRSDVAGPVRRAWPMPPVLRRMAGRARRRAS